MVKRKADGKNSVTKYSEKEDLLKLTVAQLKKKCQNQGLDTSGKKQQLIDRLQDNGDDGPSPKLSRQTTIQKAMAIVEEDLVGKKKQKKDIVHKIDEFCSIGGQVYGDYNCMLNQTNIGNNNNKYYVIQVIQNGSNYYAWNRWGRVGEAGANALRGPFKDVSKAIDDFKKKFKDKTKNEWENKEKFKAVPGKYTLLEMEDEEDEGTSCAQPMKNVASPLPELDYSAKGCSLDKATQGLLKLVFDHDMFKNTMASMKLDMQKMPLGKLGKEQVMKGFKVLDELQTAIEGGGSNKNKQLQDLSSKFYTLIPHDFGRQRPAVINTKDSLKKSADLLVTLGDIAEALDMQKQQENLAKSKAGKHALDMQYELLDCKLELVHPSDKEYKIVQKYFDATKLTDASDERVERLGGSCWARSCDKFLYLWRVDRKSERERFRKHANIKNRKLLWHGTKVAVTAAILKSGLRIMPQSCKGLYFGSECTTSMFYADSGSSGDLQNVSVMFLNEVALGKEFHRGDDDWDVLKQPGYDSVVKQGQQEPDPKYDTSLTLEGNPVTVPQGEPVDQPEWVNKSEIVQSEYIVHQEDMNQYNGANATSSPMPMPTHTTATGTTEPLAKIYDIKQITTPPINSTSMTQQPKSPVVTARFGKIEQPYKATSLSTSSDASTFTHSVPLSPATTTLKSVHHIKTTTTGFTKTQSFTQPLTFAGHETNMTTAISVHSKLATNPKAAQSSLLPVATALPTVTNERKTTTETFTTNTVTKRSNSEPSVKSTLGSQTTTENPTVGSSLSSSIFITDKESSSSSSTPTTRKQQKRQERVTNTSKRHLENNMLAHTVIGSTTTNATAMKDFSETTSGINDSREFNSTLNLTIRNGKKDGILQLEPPISLFEAWNSSNSTERNIIYHGCNPKKLVLLAALNVVVLVIITLIILIVIVMRAKKPVKETVLGILRSKKLCISLSSTMKEVPQLPLLHTFRRRSSNVNSSTSSLQKTS